MIDINGIEIKVGQTLKTKQYAGGILSPAPAQIGEVVYKEFNNVNELCIRFKERDHSFYSYISLDCKINKII